MQQRRHPAFLSRQVWGCHTCHEASSVTGHTATEDSMEEQRPPPGAARRAEFKSPPSARFGFQDERRARALEEQKRVSL